MSFGDFKSSLAQAMGMGEAIASWTEGGMKGTNPGPQIQDQADAVAAAIKAYLQDLGVTVDGVNVVKKP
tara:strand:- start:902 stop:1108 length:207 start_codon:yes stop_codon:yes gene_type:complete